MDTAHEKIIDYSRHSVTMIPVLSNQSAAKNGRRFCFPLLFLAGGTHIYFFTPCSLKKGGGHHDYI